MPVEGGSGGDEGARADPWAALRPHLGPVFFAAAFLLLLGAHLASVVPRAAVSASGVLLVLALGRALLGAAGAVRRRFLWRIRRKLILSYVFIALVPLVLTTGAVVLLGYAAAGQLLAYLSWQHLANLTREVDDAGEALSAQIALVAKASTPAGDLSALKRSLEAPRAARVTQLEALSGRYQRAGARVAVFLPTEAKPAYIPTEAKPAYILPEFDWPAGATAGPPRWLSSWRFPAAFVLDGEDRLEIRSASSQLAGAWRVYVEMAVPLDEQTLEVFKSYIGADLRVERRSRGDLEPRAHTQGAGRSIRGSLLEMPVFGLVSLQAKPWDDPGRSVPDLLLVTQRSLIDLKLDLLSFQPESRQLVVSVMVLVLGVFAVIEGLSLVAGIRLARSITGSIHDISEGARRIEKGDLAHRFAVTSDDQLAEFGKTFNRMAAAVERQLAESAERERLEEELRIGRRIQQSLLPRAGLHEARFEVAAMSLPAREVGGDYYDFLELEDGRLGLLVADVSGKGTEAAFYMAEVKGLMLALARRHHRPRDVLADANRLLGLSLDKRTFVTMTYAIIDREKLHLEFGRAGHCPLLYLPAGSDSVQCLRPPGLALGLDRKGRFADLLEEGSLSLGPGDLVLFYTDGVTDTIGPDGELYGDQRLGEALRLLRRGSAEVVRDALVADLRRFAVPGPLHDDLTVIVLRAT